MNTSPEPTSSQGVLAGVRVVEFAQNAAVPQCGRLMAGMGADVIKVEPPTGDAMRHLAPLTSTESRAFAVINPGKRAIGLDLTDERARPVIDRLLGWADICLIGMKTDDIARFGLDWAHVHEVNPRLVSLEFTAYGHLGPQADQGGYDMLVQAVSGLGFSMNRSADGVPLPTRPAFIDFASGAMACAAVVAALRDRDRTGVGQRVDASLLGTALSLGTPMLAAFDVDRADAEALTEEIALLRTAGVDFDAQREHYENRVIAAGGLFLLYVRPYRTADGLISISGFSPGLMAKFHEVTGLASAPKNVGRSDPAFVAIVEAAEALFATKTTAEWIDALQAVGYPCARYNHPLEALDEPQALANRYVVELDHPDFGGYRTVGMPFGFSESPAAIAGPSPALGQHSRSVLSELGLSDPDIERLVEARVVIAQPTTE